VPFLSKLTVLTAYESYDLLEDAWTDTTGMMMTVRKIWNKWGPLKPTMILLEPFGLPTMIEDMMMGRMGVWNMMNSIWWRWEVLWTQIHGNGYSGWTWTIKTKNQQPNRQPKIKKKNEENDSDDEKQTAAKQAAARKPTKKKTKKR
jgi:hypothetical protein